MAGGVLCVLFTDLVGSTELMGHLGDTAFDTLRSGHFAGLREAIAGSGGAEVKNTGDGLLVTFTSAVDALTAATRIQQVTERHGASIGMPLAVRVGLALGEVAVEDGDVFGTPVVEAARLVVAAQPGQILATALVRAVARRQSLHRRTAEALEMLQLNHLDDHLPALAHHWSQAGSPGKAADYAARAGDRARAQLAHDEAAAFYAQALDLAGVGDDKRRLELLISLGDAQRRAGDPAHRQTLLDAARLAQQTSDIDALARSVLANTRGMYATTSGAVDEERVAALEAAVRATTGEATPRRAALLELLALEFSIAATLERRVTLSDEALRIARHLGDPEILATVLGRRIVAVSDPSTLEERWAHCGELLALSAELGDPMAIGWAWWLNFRTAIEKAEGEETVRSLGHLEATAADLGQPTLVWFVTLLRGTHEIATGRFQVAERTLAEATRLGELTGQPDASFFATAELWLLRFEQGRLGELDDEWLATGLRYPWSAARAMMAVHYCELERDDEARDAVDLLADGRFSDDITDPTRLITLALAAQAVTYLGDVTRAAILYDLLAPYPSLMAAAGAGFMGAVAHHLGGLAATLGRHDDADSHFASAEDIESRFGARPWLARTRLEWARMLLAPRRPGDAERARGLLDQALSAAVELGLGNGRRRTRAILEAAS